MVKETHTPGRGDVVWVNLSPTRGHEQRGRRPALVISPREYNTRSGLALVCPITSQIKDYPFEVLCQLKKIKGAILADQIRTIDWQEREVRFIGRIETSILEEAQQKLILLIS